jgi:hypothetical protein
MIVRERIEIKFNEDEMFGVGWEFGAIMHRV